MFAESTEVVPILPIDREWAFCVTGDGSLLAAMTSNLPIGLPRQPVR